MIPFDFITEWRDRAPWAQDAQVEQDLIMTRALVEMFNQKFLAQSLAFRGGTALYKLYLIPPARYALDELLGTKLRALYQRKKGRDLFDLWMASRLANIDSSRIVDCFLSYMEHGKNQISRAIMEKNLHSKFADPDFLTDIEPLLAPGIEWNPESAANYVMNELVSRLPGESWKGRPTE